MVVWKFYLSLYKNLASLGNELLKRAGAITTATGQNIFYPFYSHSILCLLVKVIIVEVTSKEASRIKSKSNLIKRTNSLVRYCTSCTFMSDRLMID